MNILTYADTNKANKQNYYMHVIIIYFDALNF
jgi:hypothetical protein